MPAAHEIALQLYTVRDSLAADQAGTLARVAGLGYRIVELFGFVGKADALAADLAANGLTARSAHARFLGLDRDGRAEVFEAAATVGVDTIIDPHFEPAPWTAEVVTQAADALAASAEHAAEHGLSVGYHNHAFELEARIDGRAALEVLAEQLPAGVAFELDTYWAAVGGEDAVALLGRLGGRVRFLHIKDGPIDHDPTTQTAVGAGAMPVGELLAAAPDGALPVVELDAFRGDIWDAVSDSIAWLDARVSA